MFDVDVYSLHWSAVQLHSLTERCGQIKWLENIIPFLTAREKEEPKKYYFLTNTSTSDLGISFLKLRKVMKQIFILF